MKRMARSTVITALIALGAAGCASETDSTGAEPTSAPVESASTIDVTLQEWAVLPSPDLGTAGEITFEASNTGEEAHEFVVIRTDLDAGQLPTAEDGSVDEDAVDVVGEIEELEPGASGDVTLDLDAGSYALICNLVDEETEDGDTSTAVHYRLGMRTGFTAE